MSDNEMVESYNGAEVHSDDDSSSSGGRDGKIEKVAGTKIEDSDSDAENGFGADGEPDYKPRKVRPRPYTGVGLSPSNLGVKFRCLE
jgi:hypothetical protein